MVRVFQRGTDGSRARALIKADDERRRIERDLHDGAQQRLIALRIKLEILTELIGHDQPEVTAMVRELGGDVEQTLEELRSLARGIYPSLLSDRGLGDALRTVVRRSPVSPTLEVHEVGRYAAPIESAVYFSCVEALQNVAKHARAARSVAVRVTGTKDELHFEVEDDGPGFDVDEVAAGGLFGIRDRLAAVEGELEIESSPGHGTWLSGTIPLPPPETRRQRLSLRLAGPREPGGDEIPLA